MDSIISTAELNHIRWNCRRGMLELDLVLARFLERHYAALGPSGRAAFGELLEMPDNDLWDLILGKLDSHNTSWQTVLALLRAD